MKRVTTTKRINVTLTNNLLHIRKAELYYKTSGETETIDAITFRENFSFLCDSGIFSDAIGWHYEQDHTLYGYIAECGRMNPDTEIVITVYLGICNGACKENVEKELEVTEEE